MNDEIKEIQTKELTYTIIPSKVNEKLLFNYITHELSFDKVLNLYILLRDSIKDGKICGDLDE